MTRRCATEARPVKTARLDTAAIRELQHSIAGTTTWELRRPHHVALIAAAAAPGEYVYARPTDNEVKRPDGTRVRQQLVPDVAPLRRALAKRRLALRDLGAFYWSIERANRGPRKDGRAP